MMLLIFFKKVLGVVFYIILKYC